MPESAEISTGEPQEKSEHVYINNGFTIEPYDSDKKYSEKVSPDENQLNHASNSSKNILAIVRRSGWMLPLIYTQLWVSAGFSLMQPFFPALASDAGLEAWKYGFFFSATKIAMLLGSAFAERLMTIASPRKCYLSGQITFLLFTALLGAMYWSPVGNTFLALSIVLAIVGGIFCSVFVVCVYAVVTAEFPMHTGLIISTMEFMWGSGNMIGSGLGGVLIDAWAYPLPFFVMAALMSFSLPWTARSEKLSNKPVKAQPQPSGPDSGEKQMKLYRLLADPVFMIDMVTLTLSWVIMGFNEPTLEPHLRQFGLDTTELGIVFMVQFASYTVAAPLLGLLCHLKMDTFCGFIGHIVTILAYILLGPAPFVPLEATMWMVYLSQVFTGVGMAAQFVCSYCHALKHAVARGYSDDIKTTSFISTVVFTMLMLGATVTPPIAGYLVELFGYRDGSMFLLGLLALWAPVAFFQWIVPLCRKTHQKNTDITKDSEIPAS